MCVVWKRIDITGPFSCSITGGGSIGWLKEYIILYLTNIVFTSITIKCSIIKATSAPKAWPYLGIVEFFITDCFILIKWTIASKQ